MNKTISNSQEINFKSEDNIIKLIFSPMEVTFLRCPFDTSIMFQPHFLFRETFSYHPILHVRKMATQFTIAVVRDSL